MHSLIHVLWGVSKHVAFAYLVYSLMQHRRGLTPTARTTSAVVFGGVFPDLVDKPLTVLGVLSYGRGVAHSLLTAIVVLAGIRYFSQRWTSTAVGAAFGVGYLSHLAVDLYGPLFTGTTSMDTAFLFWPVVVEFPLGVPTPQLPVGRSVIFTSIMFAAFSLWLYDGLPVLANVVREVLFGGDGATE